MQVIVSEILRKKWIYLGCVLIFFFCIPMSADVPEHAGMKWKGSETCLRCHQDQAKDLFHSVHYQWKGEALYIVNGEPIQGKSAGSVNAYCINIMGNWNDCSSCHIGLGAVPSAYPSPYQLKNIDCLVCHQQAYKRKKVDNRFVPDLENMTMSIDQAAQTVHVPVRANCLQCHARSGGGDSIKRGDLTMAHGATSDRNFDIHMSTSGSNIQCTQCHEWENHHVPGRGSDLRVTDLEKYIGCSTSTCHPGKTGPEGHDNEYINQHIARVACQTCHIPVYAKNAADTTSTEATETFRTWTESHLNNGKYHPAITLQNDLKPVYKFWRKYSWGYNLYDLTDLDPITGNYAISRPLGGINDVDSKLYPFKYKTAEQPMAIAQNRLIALDTSVYFRTGDPIASVESGLVNMGYPSNEPFTWVIADEYLMINHEVPPANQVLQCTNCHGSTTQMNLPALGYQLKAPQQTVCTQCHGTEEPASFNKIHHKHVKDKHYDCSWCHNFTRPERGLTTPQRFKRIESANLK